MEPWQTLNPPPDAQDPPTQELHLSQAQNQTKNGAPTSQIHMLYRESLMGFRKLDAYFSLVPRTTSKLQWSPFYYPFIIDVFYPDQITSNTYLIHQLKPENLSQTWRQPERSPPPIAH